MLIKRRQVILVLLVVMLGVAGYLNTVYKGTNDGYYADDVLSGIQEQDEAEDIVKNFGEAQFVAAESDEKKNTDNSDNKEDIMTKDNNKKSEKGTADKDKTSAQKDKDKSLNKNDYFSKARLSREESRGESVELLQSIADSKSANEETKQQALNDISNIAEAIEKESKIENLIMAKGFSDCVVYVGNERVNVMAPGKLDGAQAAKIMDIVLGEVSVPKDKIKIIEIK